MSQYQNLENGHWFNTTHWSVVLEAGRVNSSGGAIVALGKVCKTYWYPVYAFIRRSGHDSEQAKDLTQEFFFRLLKDNFFQKIEPQQGRFRAFLLTALKRFLANDWNRAHRVKRGGGRELISLDAEHTENRYLSEPVDQDSPDKIFERRWAMTLLEQVMAALEAEFLASGKALLFQELKQFLSGDEDHTGYAELSRRTGLSDGTLRVNVHRLRQRYRELLRLEIGYTVGSPDAIDDEIRNVFNALS